MSILQPLMLTHGTRIQKQKHDNFDDIVSFLFFGSMRTKRLWYYDIITVGLFL